jgi:DNA-binding SARP family transcriptional activator/tetratricopeptide (TPR) repeat protein
MADALDLGRVIRREALLDRLRWAQPQLILLVAPAGFGKSTLARQFVEDQDAVALCNCANLSDELDFARRIVSALAEEEPTASASLSQRQLLLGDDSINPAERVAIAAAAWRGQARVSTFVFENAEQLADAPGIRDFFIRLLAERPESRTVVVCSRASLRIHLSRFAAPHRIVTLRADDLAFDRRDLDELFAPVLSPLTLDRIFATSQGWPIAVFLLARFGLEGRLDGLVERLGDVAFEELHEYLADEVLASLPQPVLDALIAAAVIPNATPEDVVRATGNAQAGALLSEFGRNSPFVRLTADDQFAIHPLVAGSLTQGLSSRDAMLAATARAYEREGNNLRAAELHLARPNQEEAARTLEAVPVGEDRAPSMRYSRVLSSIDRSLVRRYPTLWSCNALLQTFSTDCRQLLEETAFLWDVLPRETPVRQRYYVLITRVLMLNYLGRFDEALELIESLAPRAAIPEAPTLPEHGFALYLRATILARMGQLEEAERDLRLMLPLAEMDVMVSGAYMLLGAEVARVRGDFQSERELLGRSLEFARRSELSNFVAFRLAESVFGAWLAGDDHEYERYAAELERLVDDYAIRGFAFFSACVRGRTDDAPREVDLVRWILCGHLVAAGNATDHAEALRHARAADAVAKSYANPFLRALAALELGELAQGRERSAAYERAREFAGQAGSHAFSEAVAGAIGEREDVGMLGAFVARLRAGRGITGARIEVGLLDATVRMAGEEVRLGDRELSLALALAQRPEGLSRLALFEMLWPDRDEDAAANALNVCLHRLRTRLGDEAAIVRTGGGLRLGDGARVDLWDLERRLAGFRSRELAGDDEFDELKVLYRSLRCERPARVREWDWFEPVERYICELRNDVALRLGRYAVRTGKGQEALTLAREMIAHDACDEPAREVAIQAYLMLGDRSAALQQYRQYRAVLMEELRCEPSPGIAALVGIEPASAERSQAQQRRMG